MSSWIAGLTSVARSVKDATSHGWLFLELKCRTLTVTFGIVRDPVLLRATKDGNADRRFVVLLIVSSGVGRRSPIFSEAEGRRSDICRMRGRAGFDGQILV